MAVVTRTEQKIIEYLDLGLNLTEIQKLLEIKHKPNLHRQLKKMQQRGLVKKVAHGKWIVTRKGYDCQACVLNEREIRVLRLLCDEGVKVMEVSEKLQIPYGTLKGIIKRLINRGVIRRVSLGKYERVVDLDRDILLDPIEEVAI